MEFVDYLVASGVTVEEDDPRVQPDYRDIINKFKASLQNNARVWYSMHIDKRVQDLHSAEGWKTVKSKFLCCVTMVCAHHARPVVFKQPRYPTVYRWEPTMLTMNPKELK